MRGNAPPSYGEHCATSPVDSTTRYRPKHQLGSKLAVVPAEAGHIPERPCEVCAERSFDAFVRPLIVPSICERTTNDPFRVRSCASVRLVTGWPWSAASAREGNWRCICRFNYNCTGDPRHGLRICRSRRIVNSLRSLRPTAQAPRERMRMRLAFNVSDDEAFC